jgi:uncharacterized membrane protein YdjX (TVP38/TMEM64 family)
MRWAALVGGVIAFVALTIWTGMGDWLKADQVQATVREMGPLAPAGYVGLYAVATVLVLPGTGLTLAGGVLFGRWLGTLCAVAGATLGGCVAFGLTRTLIHGLVARKLGGENWFRTLNQGVAKNGLAFILFVRLVPIFPPTGINYGAGLTVVGWPEYVLGTVLGILPGTFIFVSLADDASRVASGRPLDLGPGLMTLVTLQAIVALLPLIAQLRSGLRRVVGQDPETPRS